MIFEAHEKNSDSNGLCCKISTIWEFQRLNQTILQIHVDEQIDIGLRLCSFNLSALVLCSVYANKADCVI